MFPGKHVMITRSNRPRNRLHLPAPCTLRETALWLVFIFPLFVSCLLLSRKRISSEFATLHFVFADRRATARTTTFVEPCSIQTKKKHVMITSMLHYLWSPSSFGLLYLKDLHPIWSDKAHTWKLECLKSSYLFKHFSFDWKMNARMNPTIVPNRAF